MKRPASPSQPRWLLLFNCQALGLANCLSMATSAVAIEYCDFPKFRRSPGEYLDKIDSYDLVLTAPQFLYTEVADLSKLARIVTLPTLYFDGYHPDLCHVHSGSGLLKGPLGDYHSSLAFAAYKCGLNPAATKALFSAKMYESLGYFGRWHEAKRRLVADFSNHGLDISAAFSGWSRSPTAFMHSVNHPVIGCLHDIARALVRSQGLEDEATHLRPHDNLLNGPVFPVYEEIAEHYSVRGSYRFKLAGQYRHVDLDQFIQGCFEVYDQHDKTSLTVHSMHQTLHDRIVDYLQDQP